MPHPLIRADEDLFTWIARSEVPVIGPWLRPLSRAADHSVLWMAASAALAHFGGRRGRRAALRGLGSIAVASAIVNQPVKRAFRRPRPLLRHHPAPRAIRRRLKSSSFPSGHSASAFAFAIGAGIELPRAARPPLLALAGTVAFSRVYVGAHYPGDVIVGAGMGAAAALLSTQLWPLPAVEPGAGPAERSTAAAPRLQDGAGLHLVVNADAGTELDLDALREALPAAEVVVHDGDGDLTALLRSAPDATTVLGVAGGDGSASAAIEVALERDLPLLVIPGGTLNHLCRDLGLDSVDDALEALRDGSAIHADVGLLDGDVFINTASFGGYPEFVVAREGLESRIGKTPAMLLAGLRALRDAEPAEVELDGEPARVWLIFIGNCRYEPAGPAPSVRRSLSDGALDVRLLDGSTPAARLRLLAAMLFGRADRAPSLRAYECERLTVRSLGEPLRTARDGEVCEHAKAEFVVTKRPRALVLYALSPGSSRT